MNLSCLEKLISLTFFHLFLCVKTWKDKTEVRGKRQEVRKGKEAEKYKVEECVRKRWSFFFLFLPWLCECGSTLQRTSTLGDEGRRMLNVVALSSLRPLWFLSTIPLFLNTASPRQQGPATGFKVTFPAESSCLCFAFGSSWVSCYEPCLSLIVLSLMFIVSHFTGPLRSRSAFSWCVFYQSQFVCFFKHTLSWTHMHTHALTSRPSVPRLNVCFPSYQ